MNRQGTILLLFLALTATFICGCESSTKQTKTPLPLESIQIKLLNERVSFDIPLNWKLLKKNFGIIEKEIYYVPFDDNSTPTLMGNAVFKCHYCRPELEVTVFSDAMLKNLFDKSSENELISDKFSQNNWRIVKWIGKDGDKKFIIWDKFGVDKEVAVHVRVTCPFVEDKKTATDNFEQETLFVFDSISIREKTVTSEAESNKIEEKTDTTLPPN